MPHAASGANKNISSSWRAYATLPCRKRRKAVDESVKRRLAELLRIPGGTFLRLGSICIRCVLTIPFCAFVSAKGIGEEAFPRVEAVDLGTERYHKVVQCGIAECLSRERGELGILRFADDAAWVVLILDLPYHRGHRIRRISKVGPLLTHDEVHRDH
eukprot:1921404-Prymnesium_polylepis.1